MYKGRGIMSGQRHLFLLFLIAAIMSGVFAILPSLEGLHQRFEFQHSFKPPYVANDKGEIHFWEHGGDSLATEEQVRVCPSLHDRSGWVWCKEKFSHRNWMFDVSLKISGRGRVGADGMALWFTGQKGGSGPVFGNVEDWTGVGVVLDSFDNDGKGDSPKIQVFLSNGSLRINHYQDGLSQDSGSCQRDFRNRLHPVKIRVTFIDNVLEVWVHDGSTDVADSYDLCVHVEAVSLIPEEGYFGVSAATGGLSDDHDVLSFVVHSITSLQQQQQKLMEKADQQRVDELTVQYEKMTKEFQEKRDNYNKLHPPESGPVQVDTWQGEMEMMENVRLVHEMQSTMLREVRALSASVEKLSISGVGQGGAGAAQGGGGGGGSGPGTADIAAMEGRLSHHLSEMRAQLERSAPSGQLTASEQMQPLYEMKTKLLEMAAKIDQLQAQQQSAPSSSSPPPSCISAWFFMLVTVLQTAVVLGIIILNHKQERNAKKFF